MHNVEYYLAYYKYVSYVNFMQSVEYYSHTTAVLQLHYGNFTLTPTVAVTHFESIHVHWCNENLAFGACLRDSEYTMGGFNYTNVKPHDVTCLQHVEVSTYS